MQFSVPQFIEVEDKIVGPLTFRQFVYIIGGTGACFVIYRFLPFFIAILLILPIAALALALAFYKINKRPFVIILESALRYFIGRKLYVWRKEPKKVKREEEKSVPAQKLIIPKLSESKLRELAWSLDV